MCHVVFFLRKEGKKLRRRTTTIKIAVSPGTPAPPLHPPARTPGTCRPLHQDQRQLPAPFQEGAGSGDTP